LILVYIANACRSRFHLAGFFKSCRARSTRRGGRRLQRVFGVLARAPSAAKPGLATVAIFQFIGIWKDTSSPSCS